MNEFKRDSVDTKENKGRRNRFLFLGRIVTPLVLLAGGVSYNYRGELEYLASYMTRSVIGSENTRGLEGVVLTALDNAQSARSHVLAAPTPVKSELPQPTAIAVPTFTEPPVIDPLQSNLAAGEGVWLTDGLPAPEFMRRAILRLNENAEVNVLWLKSSGIQLHVQAGTMEPGNFGNIPGPGKIPDAYLNSTVAVWNGGFLASDNEGGMEIDGKVYKPLENGFASVAISQNGEVSMGEWGRSINLSGNSFEVRQNERLLVEKGKVTDLARNNGNDQSIWGRVMNDTSDPATWRTGMGLTRGGNLVVVIGNNLTTEDLAESLIASGAETGMPLDINEPNTQIVKMNPNDTKHTPTVLAGKGLLSYFLIKGEVVKDFFFATLKNLPN